MFKPFAFNQAFTIHREAIPFRNHKSGTLNALYTESYTLQTETKRVMKVKKSKITALVAALGCTLVAMASIVWPTDEDWTALKVGGDLYFDASGDTHPDSTDLVGTAGSSSAGYWAFVEDGAVTASTANDVFMLRMRVGSDGGNFVWQAHLDTDGDASNIEWIFQLVQSGNKKSRGVELVKTSTGGPTLGDIDIGKNSSSWLGDLGVYSRWTPIAGSTDFYVDFAIFWDEFTTLTGVTKLEDIRTVLSTSTSHANINKDAPLGMDLSSQISNVLSDNIPEPIAVILLVGVGGGMLLARRIFKRHPKAPTGKQA